MTAKQRAFLAAYEQSGIISQAAKAARIHRKDHYRWLAANPEYAAACGDAKEQAIELLEQWVRKRAMDAKRPNDVLSMFLLKAARPERYRDNSTIQHTGPDGGAISINVNFVKPDDSGK